MLKIGHRGAKAYALENTLSSVQMALEMGVDMVEIDIRITKDNHPVVIHSAQLHHLTQKFGRVRRLTLAELKKFINQYCDEKGIDRVFGEDGYITRLPQKRFEYDVLKLREILEPLEKWEEILTVDKNKFKKVISQLPFDLRKKIDESKKLEKEFKIITASKTTKK